MKILVIAPARTSSTALTFYLSTKKGDLLNFNEQVSSSIADNYNVFEKSNFFITLYPQIKQILQEDLDNIFQTNDKFIIKFTGLHLRGLSNYIDIINPKRFDEIHLLERHDFLEQCCSNCVARTEDKWHNNAKNKTVQDFFDQLSKKESYFNLTTNYIFTTAYDCQQYLLCKKYLQDNGIRYQQHFYEAPVFKFEEIGDLRKTGLNYSKLIKNYSYFDGTLNNYFAKYFNYQTCQADYTQFVENFSKFNAQLTREVLLKSNKK